MRTRPPSSAAGAGIDAPGPPGPAEAHRGPGLAREPPGPVGPDDGPWPRSPTPGGPASSVTATGSCTRRPFAAWRARPRSSSSPPTTSGPGSPMPSRWRRWPPAIARACRLNVALTEAIALGHDCGHGPGGPCQRGRARRLPPDGVRPRRMGRGRVAGRPEPVRRDPRRDPEPLLVASRSEDTRRRGGELGRPDRLRVPRLGGCRSAGIVTPACCPTSWCGSAAKPGRDSCGASSKGPWRPRWRRAGWGWARSSPTPSPPSGAATTSTSTSAPPR